LLDGELGLQQAFGVEKVVRRGQVLGLEAAAANSVETISGWRRRRRRRASLQAAGELCAGGVRLDLAWRVAPRRRREPVKQQWRRVAVAMGSLFGGIFSHQFLFGAIQFLVLLLRTNASILEYIVLSKIGFLIDKRFQGLEQEINP
jgi:hypothetical protein